jgi:hypothetical protein
VGKIYLKGRLIYYGWNLPWKLVPSNTGEGLDFWPYADNGLIALHRQLVTQTHDKDSYQIFLNEKSNFKFQYIKGKPAVLNPITGSAIPENLDLNRSLVWLSGRLVSTDITNKGLMIRADPEEMVSGVYFSKNSNLCDIPEVESSEYTVCMAGQAEKACIFLNFVDDHFCCQKYNTPEAEKILGKLFNKKIIGRIGKCGLLGRR